MYNPENQYRCTIIRGKSQTEMEDLLPLYANIVHKYCPCNEEAFRRSAYSDLSYALFHVRDYSSLSENYNIILYFLQTKYKPLLRMAYIWILIPYGITSIPASFSNELKSRQLPTQSQLICMYSSFSFSRQLPH